MMMMMIDADLYYVGRYQVPSVRLPHFLEFIVVPCGGTDVNIPYVGRTI